MAFRPSRLIAGFACAWLAVAAASVRAGSAREHAASIRDRAGWMRAGAGVAPQPVSDAQSVHQAPGTRAPGTKYPAPATEQQAPGSQQQEPKYVGSAACQRCHAEEYDTWHKTLHLQMTKPIAEATVVGDFRPGTHLEAYGRAYRMEMRDGRYLITVTHGNNPPQTFEVNYTLGARRFQGYLSKLPDGRIYVLPVFWHNETKRWIDWKEITPVPDDPSHDLRQIWNVTCVNCHATNLVKHYDVAANTYATTWTEMGIGCEACHGPGDAHIARMDDWEKHPRSRPPFDGSASNRALSELLAIFSPRTAEPRRVFDTCGYCHGNKNNAFFGFKAGDRYEDFALPFLPSDPIPGNDPQGDFWTDGRPSRFNRPQALTLTGCFMRGTITCTSCHTAHGSKNDHALKVQVQANGKTTRVSDGLCTQCHGTKAAATTGSGGSGVAGRESRPGLSAPASADEDPQPEHATAYGADAVPPTPIPNLQAHTHHAPDSPGSRCVECHMSDVNWRLFTRRRDHTFQAPVPEMTARFGVGNACNTCHDDKSPEWAARTMDQWYGNGEKRRAVVEMADVFYRAGAGDASALTDVARYAVNRSIGAALRASAADFAGQLLGDAATVERGGLAAHRTGQSVGVESAAPDTKHPTPGTQRPSPAPGTQPQSPATQTSAVNALIGAAADPEPMVRIAALRALGYVRAPQVPSIVAAHLNDNARVVRMTAAESLFNLGISRLDGSVGDALSRAQTDWIASLRTFSDVAADHTTLGWVLAETGRPDEAENELRTAARLNGSSARPQVYLGIIAARAGRYAEALRCFKSAKSIDPSFANLDRLIEEAQKRLPPGRN